MFFLVVDEILEMEESALPDILVLGSGGVPAELHFVADNCEFLVSVKENCAVDQPHLAWLQMWS